VLSMILPTTRTGTMMLQYCDGVSTSTVMMTYEFHSSPQYCNGTKVVNLYTALVSMIHDGLGKMVDCLFLPVQVHTSTSSDYPFIVTTTSNRVDDFLFS
jgi:hypothetical protein